MKKKRITYGVPGMMEFETVIMVGRAPMKILFSDGSINSLGNHPAKFTTDNLMLQHSIERSKQFKTGLIRKIREVELNEDVKVERNPIVTDPTTYTNPGTTETPEMMNEEAYVETANSEVSEAPQSERSETANSLIPIEFELNEDAKDYLADHFGIAKSKLINREAIIACGKENGVDIHFV